MQPIQLVLSRLHRAVLRIFRLSAVRNFNKSADVSNHNKVNPLTPTVAIWVVVKHPVPDLVKSSLVIFDFWAL